MNLIYLKKKIRKFYFYAKVPHQNCLIIIKMNGKLTAMQTRPIFQYKPEYRNKPAYLFQAINILPYSYLTGDTFGLLLKKHSRFFPSREWKALRLFYNQMTQQKNYNKDQNLCSVTTYQLIRLIAHLSPKDAARKQTVIKELSDALDHPHEGSLALLIRYLPYFDQEIFNYLNRIPDYHYLSRLETIGEAFRILHADKTGLYQSPLARDLIFSYHGYEDQVANFLVQTRSILSDADIQLKFKCCDFLRTPESIAEFNRTWDALNKSTLLVKEHRDLAKYFLGHPINHYFIELFDKLNKLQLLDKETKSFFLRKIRNHSINMQAIFIIDELADNKLLNKSSLLQLQQNFDHSEAIWEELQKHKKITETTWLAALETATRPPISSELLEYKAQPAKAVRTSGLNVFIEKNPITTPAKSNEPETPEKRRCCRFLCFG